MSDWNKETIEERLREQTVAVRLRFSTSAKSARIDMYYRDGSAVTLQQSLERLGWYRAGFHKEVPAGVAGRVYRHADTTPANFVKTRDLLRTKITSASNPTPAIANAAIIALPPVAEASKNQPSENSECVVDYSELVTFAPVFYVGNIGSSPRPPAKGDGPACWQIGDRVVVIDGCAFVSGERRFDTWNGEGTIDMIMYNRMYFRVVEEPLFLWVGPDNYHNIRLVSPKPS